MYDLCGYGMARKGLENAHILQHAVLHSISTLLLVGTILMVNSYCILNSMYSYPEGGLGIQHVESWQTFFDWVVLGHTEH